MEGGVREYRDKLPLFSTDCNNWFNSTMSSPSALNKYLIDWLADVLEASFLTIRPSIEIRKQDFTSEIPCIFQSPLVWTGLSLEGSWGTGEGGHFSPRQPPRFSLVQSLAFYQGQAQQRPWSWLSLYNLPGAWEWFQEMWRPTRRHDRGSTQASLLSGKPTNKTEEEKNASLKI